MKLTKHEKNLVLLTVLFVLLSVLCFAMQKNTITEVRHTEAKAVQYFIDINIADAEEFSTLPGIGPSLANRIIEYRNKNGDFKSINELAKVSGIGKSTIEKIKDYIKV